MEHHVHFWLKEEHQNETDRATFEAGMKKLFDIPNVASGIVAKPAPTPVRPVTENSWDYALSMRFDSIAEHDTYQVHPEHDVFVDSFKHFWEKVDVRDLEEI